MNQLLHINEKAEEIKLINIEKRTSDEFYFSKRNTLISAYWRDTGINKPEHGRLSTVSQEDRSIPNNYEGINMHQLND